MAGHDHDHDHDHEHGSELSETQLRVRALETVLTEKGYIDPAALDAIIEAYETKIGPRNGSVVVAKAWTDPAFKKALLEDATKAVASMGHMSRVGDHLVAVENTPKRHNMIVCTLCSCYPWEVLGLPPVWYKSAPYRSRAVKDPRGVLADFGVALPKDTEVRVWDSTAETRFIVLPMRPAGTEGWSEDKLADLVTRDSHDRHRPAAQPRPKITAERSDGRRSRHGRHGRLRQGRGRAERAAVPRALGRPRAGDAARHGLRRRLAHRPSRASRRRSCRRRPISPRRITSAGRWRWRRTCSSAAMPRPRSSRPGTRRPPARTCRASSRPTWSARG